MAAIRERRQLTLAEGPTVAFDEARHLLFLRKEKLPQHTNGMRFTARDDQDITLDEYTCYSVGGGFVVDEADAARSQVVTQEPVLAFPYKTGDDLLRMAVESKLPISEMTLANERAWRSDEATRSGLLDRWRVMQACVERGCRQDGILPGGLKVRRRAPELFRRLSAGNEE